jgi:hypothetical protein
MARTIKLRIRARGVTDSPTVEDLLDQIRDYFEILSGVEEAVAEDGRRAIDWRVIKATTNTPIEIELAAFPKDFGINIDHRVDVVTKQTAIGLYALQTRGDRPDYFTDGVLTRAERLFDRVTNGLDQTIIDYGPGLPPLDLTPAIARRAIANTRAAITPKARPYKELGSIEGHIQKIERDGFGRRVVWIRERLTGETVKCLVSGEAERELEYHQFKDVWQFRRVRVYGTLYYKGLGILKDVEAIRVRFMPLNNDELPTVDDILDKDFTGGLTSEEYLARLRDGGL